MVPAIRKTENGLDIFAHVQPGASRTEFAGLHGERIKIRVKAKPKEGEANEAVREMIAKAAGVAKSQVILLRGGTSRDKDLRIECKDPEMAKKTLELVTGGGK